MPRPERPVDASQGPVQRFAADLRRLRADAGSPPYRELAKTAHFSKATLSAAAAGHRLPTWEVTRAYVRACGADTEEWQVRWQETRAELGLPAVSAAASTSRENESPDDRRAASAQRHSLHRGVLVTGMSVLVVGAAVLVAWTMASDSHHGAGHAGGSLRPTAASSEPLGRFAGGKEPIADNNDPKKTGCAYDPAIATVDRVELNTADEHYLGEAELRYSPRCNALWGRFTPSEGMNHLKNATVRIVASRPATSTTGVPYTTRFDGQAVFGNILADQHGCVLVTVVIQASANGTSAATNCKP